ncbi:MAG: quinone-dependent dihydroorotate dehydrogenase [Limisphaerales bacterium]
MSWLYRRVLRPCLFVQDSERIHHRTLAGLARVGRSRLLTRITRTFFASPQLPIGVLGLQFPNPVGLAAGMDKFGEAVPVWESMGFGFSELGGITRHSQSGNDRPRMFRVVPDEALINRMGFNNPGAEEFAKALGQWRTLGLWPRHPVGINLGKSKVTPLNESADDYAYSFRILRDLADFFVVNVSSPNTPNLRQLQDRAALDEILAALQEIQAPAADSSSRRPILVKVAPDLTFEALDEIVDLALARRLDGLVATNTTISRPTDVRAAGCSTYSESGGLSGRPLQRRSTEVIRHLHRQTGGRLPIVGVGGIFDAADAWEKIQAGASLIQVYTGLVYRGPGIARSIVRGLRSRLDAHGFANLAEAVGTARDAS